MANGGSRGLRRLVCGQRHLGADELLMPGLAWPAVRELLLLLAAAAVLSSWAGPGQSLLGRPGSGIMIERKRVTLSSRMLRFVQDLIECHGVRMTACSCNHSAWVAERRWHVEGLR